jgi:hypothetical protein
MKRVITGHDANGRSVFTIEDEPKPVVLEKAGGLCLTELWADPPPDSGRLKGLQPEEHFASMGAKAADKATRRHPGMHRTKTLDYAIVLSGEIHAVLDESEVLLKAGDVLVQRATNHAWSNRTEKPCVIAFVLIDATT